MSVINDHSLSQHLDTDHALISSTQLLSDTRYIPWYIPGAHPSHIILISWSVIVVKKTRTQDHLSRFILFRNENGFWFPFDGNGKLVRNEVSPFPLHLMMALNIYLYKLMITNEPFCPVCLPDPDTSLSFFVGTLQKYTVTEHWQKQQNIFEFSTAQYWEAKQLVIKTKWLSLGLYVGGPQPRW